MGKEIVVNEYDEVSVSGFIHQMPHRIDGVVTLVVAVIFIAVACLGLTENISVGRLQGVSLFFTALGIVPILFLFYASLVYFSTSGSISNFINAALIVCVPFIFYFYV